MPLKKLVSKAISLLLNKRAQATAVVQQEDFQATEVVIDITEHPEVRFSDEDFWAWADNEAQKVRALIEENQSR